ncbi:hypothetical protein IHQ56_04565 [Methylobacillus flagellatus]|uniref:hypothetical protein n=1 Tax=Methylobacillus flagellatus TaxID=405 RepID=UPI0028541AE6|nr:hypothetical protein [Methylobacillus flagellatus]MDR5171088.1 hypothetical protein [Methylobacillus flagellatus]
MSRPAPVQPAYDFSSASDPVVLLRGAAEVCIRDDHFFGEAELLLRFAPAPRVIFHAKTPMTGGQEFPFFFDNSIEPSFSFNGQKIDGFLGGWKANADALELDWHPESEPVVLCDMQSKTSVAAIFHLFNFPDFRGGLHQEVAPLGCALLVLESEEWKISLQELPGNATREAWNRIKNEGGCFLTHVVKMERKEGEVFSGEDASEQYFLLANFLSFVKGGRCWPVCGVGLDAIGQKTWETFASPRISNPPYSWFNPFKASQAEHLFPLFAKRWQQSEEWRDCLRSAIYWYAQANTGGGSPGIDAAIILAQSALERLAHHYLVVDKKMISPEGLDRLKASDRLRLLFSSLHLPVEISAATPEIQKVASNFKWVDAPQAMTDIRNELVHPVSKKQVSNCFFDAWKLSLWYLELSLLALCGYADTYTSRLTAKYVTQSEKVPWEKKA